MHPRLSRYRRRVVNAYRSTASLPDKRRSLPRWAAFELLRPATPLAAVESGGLRYLVRTDDRGVSRVTYITGDFELAVMADALERLTNLLGRDPLRDRVFVDVGANVGTSSLPALARFGASRAVAFEPGEENFRILTANVALNGLAARVDARQAGISDAPGEAELEIAPRNSGDNRIRNPAAESAFDAYRESARPTTTVELLRLDDALDELGVDPADVGLLWVDTQGHEGHVLAGAPKLLAAGTPVFTEYWPYGLRRAGGLDRFHALVAATFTSVVDVRADTTLPAARIAELADVYGGETYSDLILV